MNGSCHRVVCPCLINSFLTGVEDAEQYQLERVDQLEGVSDEQLEKHYSPSNSESTIIMPEGTGEYVIGRMPLSIARYTFLRGIRHKMDVNLLEDLDFKFDHPDILNSRHLKALSYMDKLYYTQLYKDYVMLKKWIGSKEIETLDQFVTKRFQEKVRLETTYGWDRVLFQLFIVQWGNRIRVVVEPVKMMAD